VVREFKSRRPHHNNHTHTENSTTHFFDDPTEVDGILIETDNIAKKAVSRLGFVVPEFMNFDGKEVVDLDLSIHRVGDPAGDIVSAWRCVRVRPGAIACLELIDVNLIDVIDVYNPVVVYVESAVQIDCNDPLMDLDSCAYVEGKALVALGSEVCSQYEFHVSARGVVDVERTSVGCA